MDTALARLPSRYWGSWLDEVQPHVEAALAPSITVLDVGGGRQPVLDHPDRLHFPVVGDLHYVGLDVSEAELAAASADSYDEVIVGDITERQAELDGRFDLIVSWQVLEHVKPLDAALANVHAYLRPGGRFIAHFSASLAWFALADRVIPERAKLAGLSRFKRRPPESVFPACYHKCRHSTVQGLLADWSEVTVKPRFLGAEYLSAFPSVQSAYLRYENWAERRGRADLATHLLVDAVK